MGARSSPILAILGFILYLTSLYSEELFNGYKVGFEIVVLNGLLVFGGLYLTEKRRKVQSLGKTERLIPV